MTTPTLTDHALDFILATSWAGLPPEVQHQAHRCLLDGLAALIAGTQTPVAAIMADIAAGQFGGDEAVILRDGRQVSLLGAALANGFAANALDIDDGYRRIKGHPGVCVLPALLAIADLRPMTGAEFLTALVVGYEIGIRAGLIRHATYAVYHSSGSWGAIAAAAAAGRLLGLDRAALQEALGAAEYHAPIAPMMKGIDRPAMGKDSTGWGAMVGLASALMAAQGFTGVQPLFDDAPQPEWVLGLGRDHEILNLYFKPYACCRWSQPAIAAALTIAQAERLSPAEIDRIRVRTFEAAARLSRAHPQNTEQAQYNLAYPVAAALVDGELGPRQVLPPRLFDPDLLALADRVVVEVEADYEAAFPGKAHADVVVTTGDGRTITSGRTEARWEPPNPPGDGELESKFTWLVAPVLGQSRSDQLAQSIWRLDQQPEMAEFVRACVVSINPSHPGRRSGV